MGYLTGVNILVTGSNGQLGTCIKDEVNNGNSKNIWHFADRSVVDITDIDSIRKFVIDNNIKVIIDGEEVDFTRKEVALIRLAIKF